MNIELYVKLQEVSVEWLILLNYNQIQHLGGSDEFKQKLGLEK